MQTSIAWINNRTGFNKDLDKQATVYKQQIVQLDIVENTLLDQIENKLIDKLTFRELMRQVSSDRAFANNQIKDINQARKELFLL